MKEYKIAVIPGDGIGIEVINEGVKVFDLLNRLSLDYCFELDHFDWGSDYYLKHGSMMPEDGIDILSGYDAVYLGAVGDPRIPDNITLWDLLLRIRKEFNQYINLRPVILIDNRLTPLSNVSKIDMTFIRENIEGEYAGKGSWENKGLTNEKVVQEAVFHRENTEKVIRYAFEMAKFEGKTLTNVSKANALNYSMVFWDGVFEEISKEYPTVNTQTILVDAAAMFMVTNPDKFEIVVTSNLFGDILTDLGAAITGGMGIASGANLNPEKEFPSMFEPIHGSAPDIAGKNIANPMASIWSISQMLDHFGLKELGKNVLEAIEEVLKEHKILTRDLKGKSTTQEVGQEIRRNISKKMEAE